MLKTSKVTPALIVVVFLIQGAISLPVPIPQYTYYSDDFPNPFEKPVSIDQLPDGFRNFNPFKFDPFFNDDGSSQMDAFGNDIFEDYPLDVPFSYFM
ncbi:unnamed protein product [Larinioides sclopetarius]|uniref:Uncharacterized protein n=1 Tax=Larinioides sclopetarius TaxID=280406 RepID=A0AAV2BS65_9ARAC